MLAAEEGGGRVERGEEEEGGPTPLLLGMAWQQRAGGGLK